MAHNVFISYASVDKSTADAVCGALEAAGIACWIAPRNVSAGRPYAEEIVDGIHAAKALLLVFSAAAGASVQVQRELDRAVAAGLPILPLRIEETLPSAAVEYYLAGQHWLDAFTQPLEDHLAALTEAVGSLLAQGAAPPAPLAPEGPQRDERRVISVLRCGLCGFAEASERLDPEDAERLLAGYGALVASIVAGHGGTLEQQISDGLLAVFGLPQLHEDDPERAVRAGLRIAQESQNFPRPGDEPLAVCVAISTGTVLVRGARGAAASEGFLAGAALEVAARLLAAAPPGGVVVGEATHELTERAIQYEPLAAIAGAGAGKPLSAWLATAPVSRLGIELGREQLTPLVGRATELAYLKALFEKCVAAASPQVALIVGEPGIGKSRLVSELLAYIDARPELVTWRQGRCLPYGEGVTFWALSEIVKAQAGILETDDVALVEAKLEQVVAEGPDREWLRQRLRALLGLAAPQASREENFAAWLRFLEGLAAAGPAVLVFEDLHWADEALLAFLEHLAANAAGVPLLIVATARPGLFEQHPAFAGSTRVNRLALDPLSPAETAELVTGLLETNEVADEAVSAIVERCDGNPFFAEESARLAGDAAATTLPASVQAVIAARLDALPPGEKAVLSDASVVGDIFWGGAVAALGDRSADEVTKALSAAIARQLVHRVRESTVAGEDEYAFRHSLTREVAYQQLPRAARGRRHAAAAAWLENRAGERAGELAEILAYHYATALDLARAAGEVELATELLDPAIRWLLQTGNNALLLDVSAAERHFTAALELAPADHPERPRLLWKWGEALEFGGRLREAIRAYEDALGGFDTAGSVRDAASVMLRLAIASASLGESERAALLMTDALDLLEADGPSPELVRGLCTWAARQLGNLGDARAALATADRAIAMAEAIGTPEPVIALGVRGVARCELGDAGGFSDYDRSLEAGRSQGLGMELAVAMFNRVGLVFAFSGPGAALPIVHEASDFSRRRGFTINVLSSGAAMVECLCMAGRWDEALAKALEIEPELHKIEDNWDLVCMCYDTTLILAHRGDLDRAWPLAERNLAAGREAGLPWYPLQAAAIVHAYLGELDAASAALREWLLLPHLGVDPSDTGFLPEAVRIAMLAGNLELAGSLAGLVRPGIPLKQHVLTSVNALLAETRGEAAEAATGYAAAASAWHEFGVPFEEAHALLGQGRCLLALQRAREAAPTLEQAREIFARLEARPALITTERLIEQCR